MKKLSLALLAVSTVLMSCSKEETTENPSSTTGNLSLNLSNLAPTGMHERYEGWIIVDGAPVSTGLFEVDANGTPSQTSFEVASADLSSATMFVLSLEPHPDTDPAPSDIKLLGGAFNGNTANVSTNHPAALDADLSSATGTYILATPTTSDMMDERSGIWFLDLGSGTPAQGLDLPALPANWVYEGWAVINGTPVSTGTFSGGDMADAFDGFSGSDAAGPPFPGEDFIMNAPAGLSFPTDLRGATAVITIEPIPDNSPMPFAFKPLVHAVSASADAHTTYMLDNQTTSSFPTGSVSR